MTDSRDAFGATGEPVKYVRSSSASKYLSKKPAQPIKLNKHSKPIGTGDIFNDPDFAKLMECGEIDLGNETIQICASEIKTKRKLGGGQYGNVYACNIVGRPDLKLAYKDICLETTPEKKKSIISELEVTKKVKDCRWAVQTYCQITSGINLWLVMELMDLSANDLIEHSLKIRADRDRTLFIPEAVVREVSYSCVQCLSYLKTLDLMHRDVKPSNILIRIETGEVKLGDFGICGKLENSIAKSKIYQYNYLSPERVNYGQTTPAPSKDSPDSPSSGGRPEGYTVKSDIWAMGVTTYELAALKHPFYVKNQIFATWKNIVENKHPELINCGAKVSEDLNDFVNLCLEKEPEKRATYSDLLEHSFIRAHDEVNDPKEVTAYCRELLADDDEDSNPDLNDP